MKLGVGALGEGVGKVRAGGASGLVAVLVLDFLHWRVLFGTCREHLVRVGDDLLDFGTV